MMPLLLLLVPAEPTARVAGLSDLLAHCCTCHGQGTPRGRPTLFTAQRLLPPPRDPKAFVQALRNALQFDTSCAPATPQQRKAAQHALDWITDERRRNRWPPP